MVKKRSKMKPLLTLLLLLPYTIGNGQTKLKSDTSENWGVEMSTNISYYNSLSISIEKEFHYNRWVFGPRVELLNLFQSQFYNGGDSTYEMNAQFRIRLAQIEYRINPNIKVGISPFWMLGPIPQRGYYKTPTSIYADIRLKEGLSFETTFTTSQRELVQLSVRKRM